MKSYKERCREDEARSAKAVAEGCTVETIHYIWMLHRVNAHDWLKREGHTVTTGDRSGGVVLGTSAAPATRCVEVRWPDGSTSDHNPKNLRVEA